MKMDCEILEVKSKGTSLGLTLQGRQDTAAQWREWNSMVIDIPATEKAKKAFRVGRRVSVVISAE